MKKRIGDFSLKYKASIIILMVTLIPLIVLGISIIMLYSNAIEERSHKHISENIRIMTSRISGVFTNANLCGNHILLNLNQIEDENVKQQIIKDNTDEIVVKVKKTTDELAERIQKQTMKMKDIILLMKKHTT